MLFEWEDAKSMRDAIDRQLPFDMAVALFDGLTSEAEDTRRDYGEVRTRAIGVVRDIYLVCVYTDRGAVRRIISLRLASRRERDDYRAAYPD
jgi:uncharacterized DUF497 family protein